MTKESFNKTTHDFGEVNFGETHYADFQYLGDEKLTSANFRPSCGCTGVTYDTNTKIMRAGLRMDARGTKQTTVSIGGVTIILKALVK